MDAQQQNELTVWEAKERAGLLALETDEWRQKRLIAEDPDTTANVLERFARDIAAADSAAFQARENNPLQKKQAGLLVEALLAHPNTAPLVLARLLNRSPSFARAFCDNPITPFLLLEMPDFVTKLRGPTIYSLLREERAPPSLVRALASLPMPPKGIVPGLDEQAWEINLHIALAGEIQTQAEFDEQFKAYWRDLVVGRIMPPVHVHVRTSWGRGEQRNYGYSRRINANCYSDLYELGLTPAWLGKPPLVVEPSPHRRMLISMVKKWLRFESVPGSPEERALWEEIAPDLAEQPELARLLGENATADDLSRLALMDNVSASSASSLHRVIAAHPNTTPDVMKLLLRGERYVGDIQRLLTAHPHISAELIASITQCSDAEARRLARRHPLAPPNVFELSRAAALNYAPRGGASPYELLIACLHKVEPLEKLIQGGESIGSFVRMLAAIGLPTDPVPLPNAKDAVYSTCDLLNHLAHDGNRLVRWAAQTRLADSDFTFTWHEDGE